MKIVLKTVGQTNKEQPKYLDTTKYARKNWIILAAYDAAASLAVGLGIAAAIFVFLALDDSKHGKHKAIPIQGALNFSLAFLGVVSAVMFLIQLMAGPFVFTKDVVCRKCHMRSKVDRIPFFAGRYSRPPRCQCGGKIEPAFLWKPKPDLLEKKIIVS